MLKKVERSSVNILCRYDVISLLSQVLDRVCDRCCSGCYCKCCCTTFKSCDSLLKYIFCRVCQTSVNVSCISQSETVCCMLAVAEYIGRCLVDRYCSCICLSCSEVKILLCKKWCRVVSVSAVRKKCYDCLPLILRFLRICDCSGKCCS